MAVIEATPAPATGLMTRAQAARLLGVSEATIRRREGTELKPIVRDGVHYHLETQVRSMLTVRRSWSTGAAGADGGVAADVFELLQAGATPVDIVMRLRLTPEVVKRVREQWAEMRETFVVSPDDAVALGVKSAAELVSRVGAREDRASRAHQEARRAVPECVNCRSNASCVCEQCVRARGPFKTRDFALETRTDECGQEQVRANFWAVWHPFGDTPHQSFRAYTDWAPRTGSRGKGEALAELVTEYSEAAPGPSTGGDDLPTQSLTSAPAKNEKQGGANGPSGST